MESICFSALSLDVLRLDEGLPELANLGFGGLEGLVLLKIGLLDAGQELKLRVEGFWDLLDLALDTDALSKDLLIFAGDARKPLPSA